MEDLNRKHIDASHGISDERVFELVANHTQADLVVAREVYGGLSVDFILVILLRLDQEYNWSV